MATIRAPAEVTRMGNLRESLASLRALPDYA
jgi:hypothetical protein